MDNYISVDNINEASHWLSLPDKNSMIKNFIIPLKIYELFKLKDGITNEEEIYIFSEDYNYSCYYLCHKGMFLKRKEEVK